MRVLYVVPDPGVTPRARGGGFQTHVTETIRNLEALGHQVSLLDSGKVEFEADGRPRGGGAYGWKERLPRGLRVVGRDTLYLLHNRRFRRRLQEWAQREGPFDVVYERYHAFEWAPGAWARAAGIPWVLEFNASVDELKLLGGLGLGTIGRAVERRVTRRAHHVIAVSGVLGEQLRGMGVEPHRVHVLHNGVDERRFRPDLDGSEIRRRFGLEGRVVIGFVGSFAAYHGVDLFLEAARRVTAARQDTTFFLVGGRRGNLRYEALRAATAEAERRGSVVYAGEVPHSEIPSYLAAMDAAVIPMAADYGSPTKTFEYMAMGRAVVAPAVPALREVLEDRVTALLTRPGDVDDLERACAALASDAMLRARLGRGAREAVVARHTWSGNAKFIHDLLERAVAEGPR
ncbi:MAG: glycosyltransferase family 4 protein [Candidatus Eisenbacteria bacterium]|nr:glycosyltransferase family 4 protein [Candidatus Eisenbacteria bacterium]